MNAQGIGLTARNISIQQLTTTTTGSLSLRCSSRLTKFVWICSKKGPSDGPLPNRDSVPKSVNAAARTAGAGCMDKV